MINTFLDPAQLPSRTQEQKIFDIFMGQFMQNLPTFAQQVNDTAGQVNSAVAGGAYALPYVFDSSTADTDPGPGKLRLSSATQSAATVMRLDVLAGGQDVTSMLDQFDASTSGVKGSIRLVKIGDPSKWLTFDVTARAAPSGYRNLAVVNTGGSSASPFAAPDGVLLFFQRNGDRGDANTFVPYTLDVREEGSAPSAGIGITTGIWRRVLNTVKTNDIAGASLASNQITLPAGKYRVRARATIDLSGSTNFIGRAKVAIFNVTDGTYALMGESGAAPAYGSNYAWSVRSQAEGLIILTSQKVLEIRSIHQDTASSWGGGVGVVSPDVFTQVIFEKIG